MSMLNTLVLCYVYSVITAATAVINFYSVTHICKALKIMI